MTQTIVTVKVDDIINKSMTTFNQHFGGVASYGVRRYILSIMKKDLLEILSDVVDVSLSYFRGNKPSNYKGRTPGKMEDSLRKGVKVKGETLSSLTAILQGVDYTIMHEDNIKFVPKKKYLAIPLTKEFGGSACREDGRPIFTRPEIWSHHYKTFPITGEEALNTYNRTPTASEINQHDISQVKYIVYRDPETGNLKWLYKLVPYSLFVEGKGNVDGRELRKLGLRARTEAAIASAINGWWELIWDICTALGTEEFKDLAVYKGVSIKEVPVDYARLKTYSKSKIPKGKVASITNDIITLAEWTSMIITV